MNATHTAAILSALSAANGKRRERTADIDDAARIIRLVAKGADRTGLRRTCGTVANSYRAAATIICAARVGDVVRVWVFEGNAAKVAGGGNGFTESAKNQDAARLLGETPPDRMFAIPVSAAKRKAPRPREQASV